MIRYRVTLTAEERAELEAMSQKGVRAANTVLNALILLNCDEGSFQERRMTNEDVAAVLKISPRKIDRLKKRFVEEGLEAALERRKSERLYERKADGEFEARLVALSCSAPPKGFARWSLRLLADRVVELGYVEEMSYETVRRVLKKTKSNPGKSWAG
jgi:transposase